MPTFVSMLCSFLPKTEVALPLVLHGHACAIQKAQAKNERQAAKAGPWGWPEAALYSTWGCHGISTVRAVRDGFDSGCTSGSAGLWPACKWGEGRWQWRTPARRNTQKKTSLQSREEETAVAGGRLLGWEGITLVGRILGSANSTSVAGSAAHSGGDDMTGESHWQAVAQQPHQNIFAFMAN